MTTLADLWDSRDAAEWHRILDRYWDMPTVVKNMALERRLHDAWTMRSDILASAQTLHRFLRDEVYPWKGEPRYVPGWQHALDHYNQTTPQGLKILRKALSDEAGSGPPQDAIKRVTRIGGAGIPVASACLALLYPEHFGTVDRWALRGFLTLRHHPTIDGFRAWVKDPDTFLNQQDDMQALRTAELMILLYRDRADRLRVLDPEEGWTPRKVDMVVWTLRDGSL